MCRPLFEELFPAKKVEDNIEFPTLAMEPISEEMICCSCDEIISDEEEPHVLECGCVHHLNCLLNDLESLQVCANCEAPIEPCDFLLLAVFQEIQYEGEPDENMVAELP